MSASEITDSSSPGLGPTRRALIVDDHEDAVLALEMLMQAAGYETETAMDGMDALRKAIANPPAVVILDIGMPKLDGVETCGVLRAQPWGRDVKLIAITGWDIGEVRKRCGESSFDAVLLKPLDIKDLESALNDLAGGSPRDLE